jgi:hypothetical protein
MTVRTIAKDRSKRKIIQQLKADENQFRTTSSRYDRQKRKSERIQRADNILSQRRLSIAVEQNGPGRVKIDDRCAAESIKLFSPYLNTKAYDKMPLKLRGVRFDHIRCLIKDHQIPEDYTTGQVVENIIKKITKADETSYFSLLCTKMKSPSGSQEDKELLVGKADFMASHAWNTKFHLLISMLEQKAILFHQMHGRLPYVLMDICCLNQHELFFNCTSEREKRIELVNALDEMLKAGGEVVLCVHPWRSPLLLTRMWCIFEIYRCLALGIRVSAVVSPSDAEDLHAYVASGGELIDEVVGLNTAVATASVPADRDIISRTITKTVGFGEVNSIVHKALLQEYLEITACLSLIQQSEKNRSRDTRELIPRMATPMLQQKLSTKYATRWLAKVRGRMKGRKLEAEERQEERSATLARWEARNDNRNAAAASSLSKTRPADLPGGTDKRKSEGVARPSETKENLKAATSPSETKETSEAATPPSETRPAVRVQVMTRVVEKGKPEAAPVHWPKGPPRNALQ